eukprot:symbB.v1.2.033857.t1/scaffold4266.1/size42177/1
MGRPRLRFSHLLRQYVPRRLKWSQESKRRLGLICGHAGYVTGLFEYIMTDMLHLRLFAVTGCALIVGFQAVQPRKQWVSVGWNSIYCAVNLFHISLLVKERPRSLQQDEQQLQKVLGDHVLHTQILSLCEAGKWRQFLPGSVLIQEGSNGGCDDPEMEVRILVRGNCDLHIRGFKVGHLSPGAAVGNELLALRLLGPSNETGDVVTSETEARATVESSDEVLCLCLPWSSLKADPSLLEALRKGFVTSLAAQVAAGDGAARLLEYAAVLEMACYSASAAPERTFGLQRAVTRIWSPTSSRRVPKPAPLALTTPMLEEALERLRLRLGISAEEHSMVVKTLPEECHGHKLLRFSNG